MKKKILFFLSLLLLIPFSNSELGLNNPDLPKLISEISDPTPFSNASFNESHGDDLWLQLSGGNANQNIDIGNFNLTVIDLSINTISDDVSPDCEGCYNLGSSSAGWDELYMNAWYNGVTQLMEYDGSEIDFYENTNFNSQDITDAGTISGQSFTDGTFQTLLGSFLGVQGITGVGDIKIQSDSSAYYSGLSDDLKCPYYNGTDGKCEIATSGGFYYEGFDDYNFDNLIDANDIINVGHSDLGKTSVFEGDIFPVVRNIRNTSSTNQRGASFSNCLRSQNDMADGFGGGMIFEIGDNSKTCGIIGGIYGVREGSDTTGSLQFFINSALDLALKLNGTTSDFQGKTILNRNGRVEVAGTLAFLGIGDRAGFSTPQYDVEFYDNTNVGTDWDSASADPSFAMLGDDPYFELIGTDLGTWGSAFTLGQVDGTAFENKWSWIRQTNGDGTGDGSFRATYGTNANPFSNPAQLTIHTNGSVDIPSGDLSQAGGNATINNVYGQMGEKFGYDTPFTFSFATAGVYYNMTNMTFTDLNGFNYTNNNQSTGGSYLTAQVSGKYKIEAHFSGKGNAVGGEYGIVAVKNFDKTIYEENCYISLSGLVSYNAYSIACLMDLNVGDTFNIQIEDEANPTKSLDISTHNVVLWRIGN